MPLLQHMRASLLIVYHLALYAAIGGQAGPGAVIGDGDHEYTLIEFKTLGSLGEVWLAETR